MAVAAGLLAVLPISDPHAQHRDAEAHQLGPLTVEAAWARIGRRARAGAAYLRIVNAGAEADRLLGASTAVAERAELHTHAIRDGAMRMRRIDGVSVPGGGAADLKPGGDHVMLIGLTGTPKQGGTFPLTLTFEKAGEIAVPVTVRPLTARGPGMKPHDHE